MACHHTASRQKNGGRTRDRTGDTGIFSPLLYLLSYPATFVVSVSLASRLACCFITLVLFFKIANFFLLFFDFSWFFRPLYLFFCFFLEILAFLLWEGMGMFSWMGVRVSAITALPLLYYLLLCCYAVVPVNFCLKYSFILCFYGSFGRNIGFFLAFGAFFQVFFSEYAILSWIFSLKL